MESSSTENPPASAELTRVYSVSLPATQPGQRPLIKSQVTGESIILRAPVDAKLFSTTTVSGKKTLPSLEPARSTKPHHSQRQRWGKRSSPRTFPLPS